MIICVEGGLGFRPSEFWHLVWDLGIWVYLLGSRNLDISFGTLDFVYLVWGSRKPTEGGRRSRRAGETREGDGARTIFVIAVLKSMGKCFLSQYYHLPYVIWKTMICENLNSVENRGRKNFSFTIVSWKRFDYLLSSSVLNASIWESIVKSWIPNGF